MLKFKDLENIQKKFALETLDLEEVEHVIENKYKEDGDDSFDPQNYIESYIKSNLFGIVVNTIKDISGKEYYFMGDMDTDDDDYRHINRVQIYWDKTIKGYSRLIDVSLEDYGVPSDVDCFRVNEGNVEFNSEDCKEYLSLITEVPGDFSFNYEIENVNYLNGEVSFKGLLSGPGNNILLISNEGVIFKVHVTGIENATNSPSWLYYLIDGLTDINNNNKKMGFFNIFAALDNLINTQHEYIFEAYLELCKKIKISEQLKEKIRLYSPKEKKLQNKLVHVLKEFNIEAKNLESFKKYEKLVKLRDRVAHGGIFDDSLDINETAYTILTLIYILLLQENVEATNWKGIFA